MPLDELGPRIEHDPAFPERINVNVATCVDDRLKLRTFERGAGRDARVRDRRLRDRGRGDRDASARNSPVTVDMTGRLADHRLGSRASRSACAAAATHVFEGELDLDALR